MLFSSSIMPPLVHFVAVLNLVNALTYFLAMWRCPSIVSLFLYYHSIPVLSSQYQNHPILPKLRVLCGFRPMFLVCYWDAKGPTEPLFSLFTP